jgi:serine/threonine-protein kinase
MVKLIDIRKGIVMLNIRKPPIEFFNLLSVYIAILVLSLISSWAVTPDFGRNVALKLSQDVLKWFDDMQNPVPTWYFRHFNMTE